MEDAEAEAVLLALGPVLEWECIPGDAVKPDTRGRLSRLINPGPGDWRSRSQKHHYQIMRRSESAVRNDPRPQQAEWRASVHIAGESNGWYFRCVSPDEGKAVCERFELTGDLLEIERLVAIDYEFAWKHEKGGKESEGEYATAHMGVDGLACYVAHEVKRFWFFRAYTAELHGAACGWGSSAPHPYKTMIDAKAACERHHATGKWE